MVGWSARSGLAIIIVAILVVGSLGILAGASAMVPPVPSEPRGIGPVANPVPSQARASPPSGAASPSLVSHATRAPFPDKGAHAREDPLAMPHLPNSRRAAPNHPGPVQPFYTQAPAPMGVADIGIRNESGVLVPYELNTTSVAGTVSITNLQSIYVDGDGPDTYGIQLNSVVAGVTVFGNSSYEFWAQNYAIYTISTGQLAFGDEVWNNSNPAGTFPQNSIYSGSNGSFLAFPPPAIWQGYGPTFTIGYPFTLTLYSNTTVISDRPALYFNYTLSNSTFRLSASYDDLIFNSTVGTPTRAAPIPYYQADGYQYDPAGAINDMEIDILGNDNGDTTCFTTADATISLQYWNATAGAMEEVPSAFNAGQETGETSTGIAVYSSGGPNPVAIVRSGPSFVGGLWNYSGQSGAVADTVTVHPVSEYSFLFINIGSSVDPGQAQWVPTSTTGTGTTTFYLPAGGTYSLEYMMSDYDPFTQFVTATGSVTLPSVHLTYDPTVGIYTPLFAFSNVELATISSAGAGTVGNPYVLINDQYGSLAPQFATWNDWNFPQFPGLLITGTTAYVEVTPPSFEINLPAWDFPAPSTASNGLPLTNNLQLQFYDASNVELVRAVGILGWLASALSSMPEGSVIFWNCTDSLVLSNTFDDQGEALLLYGGTGNVVWGNTFVTTPVVAGMPSSVDGSGGLDTGINETESGDMVYNNQFEVGIPAITDTYDPFECFQYGVCVALTYNDTWNVSMQPSSNYTLVDGWNLTGSIIGTWYEGGNYWSNYGISPNPYGVLPYNDSGSITVGGDYVPLVPFTLYEATFVETGLPTGAAWNVTVNGQNYTSTSAQLDVTDPDGTYAVTFYGPSGYLPFDPPATFTVDGATITVNVTFAPAVLLVVEGGYLVVGTAWTASVNGTGTANLTLTMGGTATGVTSEIDMTLPEGWYNISASAPGYVSTPGWYYVKIIPPSFGPVFTFKPIPGTLGITVTPANASLWVNGTELTLVHGSASWTGTPGYVPVEALAPGFYPYFSNETVKSGLILNFTIVLRSIPPGTLSLTVSPGGAYAYVNGNLVKLTSDAYSASMAPGVYSIVVVAAGYITYYNNVTVTSNRTTSVAIALTAVSSTAAPGAAGISGLGWALIALLAVLAVAFLIGMLYFARRGRSGGGPPTAPPPQPWQETPPGDSPPRSS